MSSAAIDQCQSGGLLTHGSRVPEAQLEEEHDSVVAEIINKDLTAISAPPLRQNETHKEGESMISLSQPLGGGGLEGGKYPQDLHTPGQ